MPDQDINAVTRSQEYYRLKRVVQSPGDIYELTESARAIYIGPDSDIGEVQITYYNPDEPLGLETATVSVNGPFVGRIDSLPLTKVASTGQPAHILISPVDIVDNNYANPFSVANRRFNIPAVIDLIIGLKPIDSIPSVRADRTYRFPNVPYNEGADPDGPEGNDGSTDLIIPIYGRRMVTVTTAGGALIMTMGLVTLQPGPANASRILGETQTPAIIGPAKFLRTAVYRASDAARAGQNFDACGAASTTYNESDQPGPAPFSGVNDNGPAPRGMADLLIINLSSSVDSMGTLTFADVYVKLSDRED